MLLLLPAVAAFLALNVWILVTSLRSGVYTIRLGGRARASTSVSRADSPVTFWLLAAFNVAWSFVVAYVVYVMAGLTYDAFVAGQWN